MRNMFFITLVLIALVAALSGCAKASIQSEENIPESAGVEEQAVVSDPEQVDEASEEAIYTQGKLNGWIDNNSVEIEVDTEGPLAFRVSDVFDQMEGINDGDMVNFIYSKNENGQLVISSIEKVK